MNRIKLGDTVRLKASLKVGKSYGELTFIKAMDCRPDRLLIIEIDVDSLTAFCESETATHGYSAYWYSFEMLDWRTIRPKEDK